MPRRPRNAPGGFVYHALNRAVANLTLFEGPADYDAFASVLVQALEKHPTRVLGFCLMPNHWHFVIWPRREGELTDFLRWLTHTHTMRWHVQHHSQGSGHLYQGRFKAFPVAKDEHLYMVLRHVERNPIRAGLVKKAEKWPWSSLAWRQAGDDRAGLLHPWPLPIPEDWLRQVNRAQTRAELEAVGHSLVRGCPFGDPAWQRRIAHRMNLEFTLRPRGRPRKRVASSPGAKPCS
jgi:putative transposase